MIVFAFFYFLLTSLLLPLLAFPLWLYFLSKGLWSPSRLGLAKTNKAFHSNKNQTIWLHAASVGEINVLLPVIDDLIKNAQAKILVTTMTKTGKEYLLKKTTEIAEDRIAHLFIPIDFWFFCWLFIKKIKPIKLIVAETEIWPSLYIVSGLSKLPLVIINGRISDKSFTSFNRGSIFWKPIFKHITFVAAQSEEDQTRFNQLGVDPSKTMNAGNLKNDGLLKIHHQPPEPFAFTHDKKVIVFGSIRPKESTFMLKAINKLIKEVPELVFIICPRHFDWMNDLLQQIEKEQLPKPSIWSKDGMPIASSTNQILIIDEIGHLLKAYQGAKIAFVGGTQVAEYGGHNALEPASLGTPVLVGPFFEEQKTNTTALLKSKGAYIVKSSEEMVAEAKKLLLSDALWQATSLAGINTVKQEANALTKIKEAGILNEN